MSSREAEFVAAMQADTTLMATLTGGVYAAGSLGREGLTREAAPGAFAADGWLKPAAVVRQRGLVPDGAVRDAGSGDTSAVQVVEIYLYQDAGYAAIDVALDRLYALLSGLALTGAFAPEWTNTIDRQRDTGALDGASLARMDWAVYQIRGI